MTTPAEPTIPASALTEPPLPVNPIELREAEAAAAEEDRLAEELQFYEAHREDRPMAGTGLVAFGGCMAASGLGMLIGALVIPRFTQVEPRTRLIVGISSVPVFVLGVVTTVMTAKRVEKFNRWADRARLSPPKSGNGLIVAGSLATVASASMLAFSIDSNQSSASTNADEWGTVAASAAATLIGLTALGGGIAARVRFDRWERQRISAAPLTLPRGAGLSISGRF